MCSSSSSSSRYTIQSVFVVLYPVRLVCSLAFGTCCRNEIHLRPFCSVVKFCACEVPLPWVKLGIRGLLLSIIMFCFCFVGGGKLGEVLCCLRLAFGDVRLHLNCCIFNYVYVFKCGFMYKFEQFILKSSCSVYAVICILVFCGNNALKSSLKLQMAASACIFGVWYFGILVFAFAFGFCFLAFFPSLCLCVCLIYSLCIADINTQSILLCIKFTLLCLMLIVIG